MDILDDDPLYGWALYRFPYLLEGPELYEGLIRFADAAVRQERAAAFQRFMHVSTS